MPAKTHVKTCQVSLVDHHSEKEGDLPPRGGERPRKATTQHRLHWTAAALLANQARFARNGAIM
jgi:hypothetical protein